MPPAVSRPLGEWTSVPVQQISSSFVLFDDVIPPHIEEDHVLLSSAALPPDYAMMPYEDNLSTVSFQTSSVPSVPCSNILDKDNFDYSFLSSSRSVLEQEFNDMTHIWPSTTTPKKCQPIYIEPQSCWAVKKIENWSQADVEEWLVSQFQVVPERLREIQFNLNGLELIRAGPDYLNDLGYQLNIQNLDKSISDILSYENCGHLPMSGSSMPSLEPPMYENHHSVKIENEDSTEYSNQWNRPVYHPKEEDSSDTDPDDYHEHESYQATRGKPGRRGRPPSVPSKAAKRKLEKRHGRLWEFIRDLLKNPEYCPSLICWENHDEGVFRFVASEKVAQLWGSKRGNTKMTYEKLSRAMRYYYKSNILQPVTHRRLVYRFGPNATNWRHHNPNFRRPV